MNKLIANLFFTQTNRVQTKKKSHSEILMHDILLSVLVFCAAVIICNGLSRIYDDNNHFSVPVFILMVALVAWCTQGYVYGALASVFGVFCVNYLYTYPYRQFNMTISGYPLTFAAMLVVSICISTLTSRIKRQDQLRMEAEMEKIRANLLRAVSHDLRTPLTSIIGSSSVLLEDHALTPAQRDELLLEINKDARWLARITENILSVTKFSDGQLRLIEFEVVEEIVSSAIVKFRSSHGNIQITVQKPEDILLAPMDATLIEQVFLNLLDNAIVHGKHTSSINICIMGNKDGVSILVSDNGCGISEQVFPHLFDGMASRFKSQPDEHRNMGIGLSVCQSIVHAHGGSIHASNNPEGGACFEIYLPVVEETIHE